MLVSRAGVLEVRAKTIVGESWETYVHVYA